MTRRHAVARRPARHAEARTKTSVPSSNTTTCSSAARVWPPLPRTWRAHAHSCVRGPCGLRSRLPRGRGFRRAAATAFIRMEESPRAAKSLYVWVR